MSIASKQWRLVIVAAVLTVGVVAVPSALLRTAPWQHFNTPLVPAVYYDGRLLLGTEEIEACSIGTERHDACLWDFESGRMLARLKAHENEISVVAISPDGKQVLTGGGGSSPFGMRDSTIWLWDVATGQETRAFKGHARDVKALSFSADGKRFLSVDRVSVRQWDVESGEQLAVLSAQDVSYLDKTLDVFSNTTLSSDGSTAFLHTSSKVLIWDASTGKVSEPLDLRGFSPRSAAISPMLDRIVTSDLEYVAEIWDVETGTKLHRLVGHEGRITFVGFTPDGGQVITASWDRTIRVWDSSTGEEVRKMHSQGSVHRLVISPNGRTCIAEYGPGRVGLTRLDSESGAQLWNLDSGRVIQRFQDNQFWSYYLLGFSSDGTEFLSLVRDLRTGKQTVYALNTERPGTASRKVELEAKRPAP